MKAVVLVLPLAGALLGAGLPLGQSLRSVGEIQVDSRLDDDGYFVSLRADSASLDRVLSTLAVEVGYDLEGLSSERRTVLVTADLEWRSLEQVLEFVLGSVGMSYSMRAGTITVLSGDTAELDPNGLLQLASAAYLRALTRHADHPLAAGARLEQGEVADLRGYPGAALDHYQSLIDDYPRAPEVPEAYMRSGYLLQRLGRWADAAEQFRAVANIEIAKEHAAPARLELARCTIEVGDAQSALFLLSALDASHPPEGAEEIGRRALVKALALAGTDRYLESLRTVESVERLLTGADRIEGLRVRAIALQGAGNPGDAGRAWLLYALETQEPTRAYALEQAVKLSLQAGDEVGALFVVRQAEELGHKLRFAQYKAEAYDRLGFAAPDEVRPMSIAERIAEAERRIAADEHAAAGALLTEYLVGASALEPELRVRFAIAWARSVDAAQSVEPALAYLAETRADLSGDVHLERRARLDVAAAALLEAREMYDAAADAYRGMY